MTYREVTSDQLDVLIFSNGSDVLVSSYQVWLECATHEKGYQVLRFDRKGGNAEEFRSVDLTEAPKVLQKVKNLRDQEQIIEGFGLKRIELSPRKVSKEKKRILLRKITFGLAMRDRK